MVAMPGDIGEVDTGSLEYYDVLLDNTRLEDDPKRLHEVMLQEAVDIGLISEKVRQEIANRTSNVKLFETYYEISRKRETDWKKAAQIAFHQLYFFNFARAENDESPTDQHTSTALNIVVKGRNVANAELRMLQALDHAEVTGTESDTKSSLEKKREELILRISSADPQDQFMLRSELLRIVTEIHKLSGRHFAVVEQLRKEKDAKIAVARKTLEDEESSLKALEQEVANKISGLNNEKEKRRETFERIEGPFADLTRKVEEFGKIKKKEVDDHSDFKRWLESIQGDIDKLERDLTQAKESIPPEIRQNLEKLLSIKGIEDLNNEDHILAFNELFNSNDHFASTFLNILIRRLLQGDQDRFNNLSVEDVNSRLEKEFQKITNDDLRLKIENIYNASANPVLKDNVDKLFDLPDQINEKEKFLQSAENQFPDISNNRKVRHRLLKELDVLVKQLKDPLEDALKQKIDKLHEKEGFEDIVSLIKELRDTSEFDQQIKDLNSNLNQKKATRDQKKTELEDLEATPLAFDLLKRAGFPVTFENGVVKYRGFTELDLGNEVGQARVKRELERLKAFFAEFNPGSIHESANGIRSNTTEINLSELGKHTLKENATIEEILNAMKLALESRSTPSFQIGNYAGRNLTKDEIDDLKRQHEDERQNVLQEKQRLAIITGKLGNAHKYSLVLIEKLSTLFENIENARQRGVQDNLPPNFDGLKTQFNRVSEKKEGLTLANQTELLGVYDQVKSYIDTAGNFSAIATNILNIEKDINSLSSPDNTERQARIIAQILKLEHPQWSDADALKAATQRVKLANRRASLEEDAEELAASLSASKVEAMQNTAFAKLHERMTVPQGGVRLSLKNLVADPKDFLEVSKIEALFKARKLSLEAWAGVYNALKISTGGTDSIQTQTIKNQMIEQVYNDPRVKKMQISDEAKWKGAKAVVNEYLEDQVKMNQVGDFMARVETDEIKENENRQRKLVEARIELYKIQAPTMKSVKERAVAIRKIKKDIDEAILKEYELPKAGKFATKRYKAKKDAPAVAEAMGITMGDVALRKTFKLTSWTVGLVGSGLEKAHGKACGLGTLLAYTGKVLKYRPDVVKEWAGKGVRDVYKEHKEAAKERHDDTAEVEELKEKITELEKATEQLKVEIPASNIDITQYF